MCIYNWFNLSKYLLLRTLNFKPLRAIISKQIQKICPFINFIVHKKWMLSQLHQIFWEHFSLCAYFENVANSKISIADSWAFWSPGVTIMKIKYPNRGEYWKNSIEIYHIFIKVKVDFFKKSFVNFLLNQSQRKKFFNSFYLPRKSYQWKSSKYCM